MHIPWFPLGRKYLEKQETIFQSGNFDQNGKIREKPGNFTPNTGKPGNFDTGKLAEDWKSQQKFVSQKNKNHGNMVPNFK